MKLEKLPDNALIEFEKFADKLIEANRTQVSKKCTTRTQLEKLANKPTFESVDIINLARNLQKEWEIVKQDKLLTSFVINMFRKFSNPQSDPFAVKRINRDSRTGGFFEDIFCFLLKSYLYSKQDLLTPEDKFEKIKITLNDSVAVPGERRKRKPDVLIASYETGEPICIIELKASYTKRSLLKTYNADHEMWKRLNENIKFLYVILRSNSENKAKTYKKAEGCRVICCDLKTDKDSEIKEIKPQIDTLIEAIFEEIYQAIQNFETNRPYKLHSQNAVYL
ncbi:MAG: hypothetical protein ABFD07_00295 [Methanobacterium sp.]